MATTPRIAVVGGGITGTLCSLILKNRGASPVLFDAGKNGVGGRLRGGTTHDAGIQFMRPTEPRLVGLFSMLQQEGLVTQWKGRFGILGVNGGGFLPSEIVGSSGVRSMGSSTMRDDGSFGTSPNSSNKSETSQTPNRLNASDGGDFCGFVNEDKFPTYVGTPSMAELCPNICQKAKIDIQKGYRVDGAETVDGGGWRLLSETGGDSDVFDALVVATHDASLASSIVRSIAQQEEELFAETADEENASVSKRLTSLSDALQAVRDNGKMPVYTISAAFPKGFSNSIPFDAVSVPGSTTIQFLCRDTSKPARQQLDSGEEVWTAVSTTQFAMVQDKDAAEALLSKELSLLLSSGNENPPTPLQVSVNQWRAGFNNKSLNLLEDSVTLAPWRLSIAGEFISDCSSYATPFEAAALSGLEAGERTSNFFQV